MEKMVHHVTIGKSKPTLFKKKEKKIELQEHQQVSLTNMCLPVNFGHVDACSLILQWMHKLFYWNAYNALL